MKKKSQLEGKGITTHPPSSLLPQSDCCDIFAPPPIQFCCWKLAGLGRGGKLNSTEPFAGESGLRLGQKEENKTISFDDRSKLVEQDSRFPGTTGANPIRDLARSEFEIIVFATE